MAYEISRVAAEILPIAVFNALYFIHVNNHSLARWVGYACLHIAYLLLVFSVRRIKANDGATVHGYPLAGIAIFLFLAEVIAFCMEFYVNPEKIKWIATIEIVSSFIFLWFYFVVLCSAATASSLGKQRVNDFAFIRECSATLLQAKALSSSIENHDLINKALDAIRSGSGGSAECVKGFENDVENASRAILHSLGEKGCSIEMLAKLVETIIANMEMREAALRNSRTRR